MQPNESSYVANYFIVDVLIAALLVILILAAPILLLTSAVFFAVCFATAHSRQGRVAEAFFLQLLLQLLLHFILPVEFPHRANVVSSVLVMMSALRIMGIQERLDAEQAVVYANGKPTRTSKYAGLEASTSLDPGSVYVKDPTTGEWIKND